MCITLSSSKVTVLLCVLLVFAHCDGARILAIIPTPSYSHQVAFRSLWRQLTLRGHHLTLLTTDPINDPSLTNLTEIDLRAAYTSFDISAIVNIRNPVKLISAMKQALVDVADTELQHSEVQALIKNKNVHFDLVMIEYFTTALIGFVKRFDCPYIGLTSCDAISTAHIGIGNPVHPVLYPDVSLPFATKLTFMERVISTLYLLYVRNTGGYYADLQDSLIEKHFGKGYPGINEIYRNASMLFVNVNPILHDLIRPNMPNVINIGGGTHIHTPKALPQELQDHLDNATNGFIYFSLGSNVRSTFLVPELRQLLLQAFSELPYKILWKFELEDLPGKPENVLISKWFPQQDIFRHPNLKLFITQGGIQSIEEAMFNHIPMIGMPFFADQFKNVRRFVKQELGLALDHKTLTKEAFKDAIQQVIGNPKYRENVKQLVELAQDESVTGIERAIWWTEYVLRHKGAKYLKSPISDIPIYQYLLLDVIGFCLIVILVVSYVLIKLIRLVIGLYKSKIKVKLS